MLLLGCWFFFDVCISVLCVFVLLSVFYLELGGIVLFEGLVW